MTEKLSVRMEKFLNSHGFDEIPIYEYAEEVEALEAEVETQRTARAEWYCEAKKLEQERDALKTDIDAFLACSPTRMEGVQKWRLRAEEAEAEVERLTTEINSEKECHEQTLQCGKYLFDQNKNLQDKVTDVESRLSQARDILKEQCPVIDRCQDLPSDPSCDGCDRLVLWEALEENK